MSISRRSRHVVIVCSTVSSAGTTSINWRVSEPDLQLRQVTLWQTISRLNLAKIFGSVGSRLLTLIAQLSTNSVVNLTLLPIPMSLLGTAFAGSSARLSVPNGKELSQSQHQKPPRKLPKLTRRRPRKRNKRKSRLKSKRMTMTISTPSLMRRKMRKLKRPKWLA